MKKYNLSNIMKKAWGLVKNYNMDMSSALVKSWKMAKLEILENELFILNMKDISGGRTNMAVQAQIRKNNEAIDGLQKEIAELKREIYPSETKIEKIYRFSQEQIEKQRKSLQQFKEGSEIYEIIKESLISMEKPEIRTYVVIDENAYNAA